MAASLVHRDSVLEFKVRVSSVLNRDTKTYGKQFLFDGSEETCWNSDEGSIQWIAVTFQQPVVLSQVNIKFQGGFASSECVIVTEKDGQQTEHTKIYPDDNISIKAYSHIKNIQILA